MHISRIAIVAALLALAGCAGRIVTPMQPGPTPPEADPSASIRYPQSPVRPEAAGTPERAGDDYVRTRLVFTPGVVEAVAGLALQVDHYRGTAPGPRPFVIVVPIWGDGAYRYPSDKFSHHVRARSGGRIDVLQVLGQPSLIRWDHLAGAATPDEFVRRVTAMAERVRLATIVIRRMLDWAETQPALDADAAGLVGFSMGAIVSTIALGNDDRFAAGAIVMGGAQFDRIFAYCGGRTGAVRETILRRFDWTLEEYRRVFARAFEAGQPTNFRGNYDPERLLMMDAMFDDCIPERARDTLWQSLGRPRRVTFIARHRTAFLAFTPLTLNYGGRMIYRFLLEHLQPAVVNE